MANTQIIAAPAVGQVWRTDFDGLYAVVAIEPGWVWCRRCPDYLHESRYGDSFQVHPGYFCEWDLVTA